MKVYQRFEGYRLTLDKRRREIFDYLVFELAGRREEALVNHGSSHTEAVLFNVLIEQELRIRSLEKKLKDR